MHTTTPPNIPCVKAAIERFSSDHNANIKLHGIKCEMRRLNSIAEMILASRKLKHDLNVSEDDDSSMPFIPTSSSENMFTYQFEHENEDQDVETEGWLSGYSMASYDQTRGIAALPSQRKFFKIRNYKIIK